MVILSIERGGSSLQLLPMPTNSNVIHTVCAAVITKVDPCVLGIYNVNH